MAVSPPVSPAAVVTRCHVAPGDVDACVQQRLATVTHRLDGKWRAVEPSLLTA